MRIRPSGKDVDEAPCGVSSICVMHEPSVYIVDAILEDPLPSLNCDNII